MMYHTFRSKFRKNNGFTLMELMIVMVILAILVTVAVGNYASSSRRGRDSRRKNDLQNLATALEAYYNDKGEYPSGVNGSMVGCGALDAQPCPWGGEFEDQYGTLYMVLIPSDPSSTQTYYYASNGLSYMLYAKLENTRDAGNGVDQDGFTDKFTSGPTDCSTESSVLCTYGIASANSTP